MGDENLSLIAARDDLRRIEGREGEMYFFNPDIPKQRRQGDPFLSGVEGRVTIPTKSKYHGNVDPNVLSKFAQRNIHIIGEGKSGDSPIIITPSKTGYYAKEVNEKEKMYPILKSPSKIIPYAGCYILRKGLQFLDDAIAPDPTNTLNRIVKRSLNGWGRGLGQNMESNLIEFSPLGAGILDFAEGASNLYSIYTVVEPITNVETPIYLRRYTMDGFGRKHEEALPGNFDNTLRENIRYVLREMESIYNDQELGEYYREYFTEPGFDFITKGDVPDRCEVPDRPKKWAVRDASYVQHETGANIEEYPPGSGTCVTSRMLNVDGTDYVVRRYETASGWNKFVEWASFAALWRITDWAMGFRPAKTAMGKLSKELGQVAIDEQYKICSAIKRGFFYNAGRNDYDFDLKRYMPTP